MQCTNPKLIYFHASIFFAISRLFVYLRMRMSTSKQHSGVRGPLRECRSIQSGASALPCYCAPPVCVSEVIESLAVRRHNKPKPTKPFSPKNGEIALWLLTNNLMCSNHLSEKRNEFIDNCQWYNMLLNFIL